MDAAEQATEAQIAAAEKMQAAGDAVLETLQRHLPNAPALWMCVLGGVVASTAAASDDVAASTNAFMLALQNAADDIAQGEPS